MSKSDVVKEEGVSSPGAVLRAAREAAGYSRTDMAEKLNWVGCYVTAIEEDRYEAFSSRAFATGYLKSYGRYLNVPEESYLGGHQHLLAKTGGAIEKEALTGIKTPKQVVASSGIGLYVAGIALAALIGYLWWQQAVEQPANSVASPVITQANEDTSADSSALPSEVADLPDTSASTTNAVVAELLDTGVADTGIEMAIPVEDQLAAEGTLAPAGILEFEFLAECWVEVRNSEGELIYANLRQSGESLSLEGTAPFDILLGDAAAASLSYLGQPVGITAVDGRKFARFSVGG